MKLEIEMPDPTTKSNDQSYTCDDLGELMKTVFDENGAIRAFLYDVLGRLTSDGFALAGGGEDPPCGVASLRARASEPSRVSVVSHGFFELESASGAAIV